MNHILPEKNVDDSSQLTPNRKYDPLSKAELELNMMKEMNTALSMHTCSEKMKMYAAMCMHTCEEKKTFLGKADLTIVEWGEEMYF